MNPKDLSTEHQDDSQAKKRLAPEDGEQTEESSNKSRCTATRTPASPSELNERQNEPEAQSATLPWGRSWHSRPTTSPLSKSDVMLPDRSSAQIYEPSFVNGSTAKLEFDAVERSVGRSLTALAEDSEYWTSVAMKRARHACYQPPRETMSGVPLTSFAALKPIEVQKLNGREKNGVFSVEKLGPNCKPVSTLRLWSQAKSFSTHTPDVPAYSHYVSIKDNFLASNVTTLHCWPYVDDNFDVDVPSHLKNHYVLDVEPRPRKLKLMLQAQQYAPYIQDVLDDLQCSWADVLRFLLEPSPEVNPGAQKALQNRETYCKDDFDRSHERWVTVLSGLPTSSRDKVSRVAVLCETFQRLFRFSLWHLARRSLHARVPHSPSLKAGFGASSNELSCRICLRIDCPYHGELDEYDETGGAVTSSYGSTTGENGPVATDIIHPPRVNLRTRVAFPEAPISSESLQSTLVGKKETKVISCRIDERGPFYPCDHPGKSCRDADCSCFEQNIPCEKICNCSSSCARKFRGCSCSTQNGKKRTPCVADEKCVCWQNDRECDPDLCGTCGVCEVVDPSKKTHEVPQGMCQNASIQRGISKHTLLGDSRVHGLGLYACEDIRPGEFVGEYKGEIITREESERRGAIYEHQRLSYLFSLNASQDIDSTYFGNKTRFINHASDEKANLYPKIIMVNTVHRIALFAKYHIKRGQELFFNYGPMFPDEQLSGKKTKAGKSAPHVRNSNLVRSFLDVEKQEEVGSNRATTRPAKELRRQQTHRGTLDNFDEHDPGDRLAAFNVSEDGPEDFMDFDAGAGADDDDDEYRAEDEEDGWSGDAETASRADLRKEKRGRRLPSIEM